MCKSFRTKIPHSTTVGLYRPRRRQFVFPGQKTSRRLQVAKEGMAQSQSSRLTPAQVRGLTPVRPYPIEVVDSWFFGTQVRSWVLRTCPATQPFTHSSGKTL